jgi:hypothetical protein
VISVTTLLLLFWVHTLADFALQTDSMAINKSKSNKWLALHVSTYSVCLLPFGGWFALVNFAAHFCTDYVTSRMTSKLWQAGERHWFFVVIGIDQALHLTALVLTYVWIGGW